MDPASKILPDLLQAAEGVADRLLGRTRRPLSDLVKAVSHTYTRDRGDLEAASSKDALQARLRFFLARDLHKVQGPLRELAAAGGLPKSKRWKVLDIGAGLGTTSFGAALFAKEHGATLDVFALEKTALALRCFEALSEAAGPIGLPMKLQHRTGNLSRIAELAPGKYDLILLGLVINELTDAAQEKLFADLQGLLAPGGSVIVLEPALRPVSRRLQALRFSLDDEGSWNAFAPCLRTSACPMLEGERDWCHEDLPFRLPKHLIPIAKDAGLRWERLTYAYLTLRKDGLRLRNAVSDDCSRVVGGPLVTKGRREVHLCGKDEGIVRLVRLDRHKGEATAAFEEARRGHLLMYTEAQPKGRGMRLGPDSTVNHVHIAPLPTSGD